MSSARATAAVAGPGLKRTEKNGMGALVLAGVMTVGAYFGNEYTLDWDIAWWWWAIFFVVSYGTGVEQLNKDAAIRNVANQCS